MTPKAMGRGEDENGMEHGGGGATEPRLQGDWEGAATLMWMLCCHHAVIKGHVLMHMKGVHQYGRP